MQNVILCLLSTFPHGRSTTITNPNHGLNPLNLVTSWFVYEVSSTYLALLMLQTTQAGYLRFFDRQYDLVRLAQAARGTC